MNSPVRELEVLLRALELVRGERLRLGEELLAGRVEGDAPDRDAAAAVRVHPVGDGAGVAVQDLDVVDVDPELVRHHLGEYGHRALPVRRDACQDRTEPVGMNSIVAESQPPAA